MSDCSARRGQACGRVAHGVELKHSQRVERGVPMLWGGFAGHRGAAVPCLGAVCSSWSQMWDEEATPGAAAPCPSPPCGFSHPLTAAAAPIYARYLLSCSLWLEKREGSGGSYLRLPHEFLVTT